MQITPNTQGLTCKSHSTNYPSLSALCQLDCTKTNSAWLADFMQLVAAHPFIHSLCQATSKFNDHPAMPSNDSELATSKEQTKLLKFLRSGITQQNAAYFCQPLSLCRKIEQVITELYKRSYDNSSSQKAQQQQDQATLKQLANFNKSLNYSPATFQPSKDNPSSQQIWKYYCKNHPEVAFLDFTNQARSDYTNINSISAKQAAQALLKKFHLPEETKIFTNQNELNPKLSEKIWSIEDKNELTKQLELAKEQAEKVRKPECDDATVHKLINPLTQEYKWIRIGARNEQGIAYIKVLAQTNPIKKPNKDAVGCKKALTQISQDAKVVGLTPNSKNTLARFDKADGTAKPMLEFIESHELNHLIPQYRADKSLIIAPAFPLDLYQNLYDFAEYYSNSVYNTLFNPYNLKGMIKNVETCHENGIVFAEIKIENILLEGQGTAKLTDLDSMRELKDFSSPKPLYTPGNYPESLRKDYPKHGINIDKYCIINVLFMSYYGKRLIELSHDTPLQFKLKKRLLIKLLIIKDQQKNLLDFINSPEKEIPPLSLCLRMFVEPEWRLPKRTRLFAEISGQLDLTPNPNGEQLELLLDNAIKKALDLSSSL